MIIGFSNLLSRYSKSTVTFLYSPQHHETRTITFEKSSEPVGFQIQGGPAGGIFVSAVNDNSLASQAGLVIGDQLLEVSRQGFDYLGLYLVSRQGFDYLGLFVKKLFLRLSLHIFEKYA